MLTDRGSRDALVLLASTKVSNALKLAMVICKTALTKATGAGGGSGGWSGTGSGGGTGAGAGGGEQYRSST